MGITFAPLKSKIKALSRLKHEKIVSGSTYDAIRASIDNPLHDGVSISAVDSICAYLDCQPGDIMEYVPDIKSETE